MVALVQAAQTFGDKLPRFGAACAGPTHCLNDAGIYFNTETATRFGPLNV